MASADPAGALVTLASPTWTIFTTASGAGAFTGTFDGIVGGVTPAAGTATTIVGTDTTDSTISITGALKTAGGLGVAKRESPQHRFPLVSEAGPGPGTGPMFRPPVSRGRRCRKALILMFLRLRRCDTNANSSMFGSPRRGPHISRITFQLHDLAVEPGKVGLPLIILRREFC
jgi:hypothetical protein